MLFFVLNYFLIIAKTNYVYHISRMCVGTAIQGTFGFTSKMDNLTKYFTRKMMFVNVAVFLSTLALIVGLSLGLNVDHFKGSDALDAAPLIDGHNDLAYNLYTFFNNDLNNIDLSKNLTNDALWGRNVCRSCYTDLPRLKKGKVGAQFWAAYVDCKSQFKDAVALTLRQIDVIKRFVEKYPNDLQFVTETKNIEEVWKNGKIASMIGVEGGHSIDSSLAILRLYYELGVRYMTLTHTCNTPWADSSLMNDSWVNNITDFGKAVVYEMNRLGMMVDLSHVSHNVMRHVLSITKAPVIFSHSSSFTICHNYRNVPDDVLHMVKKNNGIVMVNFYSAFVNCNNSRNATMTDVIDHINYIRNLIGADHVGIGADYDGVQNIPEGLEDVSKYPDLFDSIYKSDIQPRWIKEELEKLAGRNLIRVFKAVEEVRDELAKTEKPRQDIISVKEIYQSEIESNVSPGSCYTAKEWANFSTSQS